MTDKLRSLHTCKHLDCVTLFWPETILRGLVRVQAVWSAHIDGLRSYTTINSEHIQAVASIPNTQTRERGAGDLSLSGFLPDAKKQPFLAGPESLPNLGHRKNTIAEKG